MCLHSVFFLVSEFGSKIPLFYWFLYVSLSTIAVTPTCEQEPSSFIFCLLQNGTMSSRYKLFMRLCSEWPIDATKTDRDFGMFLRKTVVERFKQGEATPINQADCDRQFSALQKINTNFYKEKYKTRDYKTSSSGLTLEQCNEYLSTSNIENMPETGKPDLSESSVDDKVKEKNT